MSAWIVSKTHIDLLITAGLIIPTQTIRNSRLRWYLPDETSPDRHQVFELDDFNADDIGVTLWAENHASVNHRYPDASDDLPGPVDFDGPDVLTYTHQPIPGPIDPVVVLKVINCYQYQSCEHPGWETSSAHAFCTSLTQACISALPGYDQAPWGFDDPHHFTKAAS